MHARPSSETTAVHSVTFFSHASLASSYPLLRLPLPGTGPVEFTTGVRDYSVPSHEPRGDLGERPDWVAKTRTHTSTHTLCVQFLWEWLSLLTQNWLRWLCCPSSEVRTSLKCLPSVFVPQYQGPPVAYIQQVLVKAAVSPWDSSLVPVDVFRSPLGRAFSLLEEIRNHVYSDR